MSFAWSHSRLKSFESCAKRHYEVDIAKNYKDETEQLKWGDQVHKQMANAIKGLSVLPAEMADYQKWIDLYKPKRPEVELIVEQKFGLTRALEPTEFFSNKVWFRIVVDAVLLRDDVAFALDWKTGRMPERLDTPQLMLTALCLFAFFPKLQRIRTAFVWLKENCESPATYTRKSVADEFSAMIGRVNAYEKAVTAQAFPPKPSRLCAKWCPVTSCPYWGKSGF